MDIPSDMKAWGPESPGYPEAPIDWDGGPYMCRDGGMYHMRGYSWKHGDGCWVDQADWDRIAYRPTTTNHTKSNEGVSP